MTAIVVSGQSIDSAWADSLEALLDKDRAPGGKAAHLVVEFPADVEALGIRHTVDQFLASSARAKPRAGLLSVETVANTIFPSAFYLPDQAEHPRDHLYEMHHVKMRFHRRRTSSEKETYFSRLTGTDGTEERGFNQLEGLVARMQNELTLQGPKSSAYELGLSGMAGDLRIHVPERDRSVMGFPCLSHISVTLVEGAVHLTAQYRKYLVPAIKLPRSKL